MILLEKNVPLDFELVLAGDTHEGTLLRDENGIDKLVKYVKIKKNRYLVFMGDAIEGITASDKRFDIATQDGTTPTQQARKIVERFSPIAGQIVTWLVGNHEWSLKNGGDLVEDIICRDLGCPFGTFSSVVTFKNKNKQLFKGFFTHSTKRLSAVSDDPMDVDHKLQKKLKRILSNLVGDCILMAVGHNHKIVICPPAETLHLVSDGKRFYQHYVTSADYENASVIHKDHRWYISTGSFLKLYKPGYTNYAEVAGYSPIELGFVVMEIKDGKIVSARKEIV